ncbi:MAG: hypothetical protein EOM50_21285 [Erysipelotrichia bacterium]|nr:hypothetical protein [Erysipelotrichia bacterium]
MKKATISIECGELAPNDGMVKVWWWKDGAELNQEWEATKPVWEIFNAHQTFLLCVVGETIEVSEKVVLSNFVQVQ